MGAHQRAVFHCLENHVVTIALPVMSALCCRSSEWFCGRSYPRNTILQQVQLATLQSALLKEQVLGTHQVKISGTSGMGGMCFGSFHQHVFPHEMRELGQVRCLAVGRAQCFSSRLVEPSRNGCHQGFAQTRCPGPGIVMQSARIRCQPALLGPDSISIQLEFVQS